MKITYLHNSGFAVAFGDLLLIFDYWKDVGEPGLAHGRIDPEELRSYRRVIAFASHAHPDHFNPVILTWPGVELILSDDITRRAESAVMMKPGDRYAPAGDADELEVLAFDSTDQGVSFLVRAQGVWLFHAGDLNFWHWREESTQAEVDEAREAFDKALGPIAECAADKAVAAAFLPVDSRIGADCDEGALAMAKALQPGVAVPMHAHGDRNAVEGFARRYNGDVIILMERGASAEVGD